MARNRRTQSAAIRFGPAIKAFLLCLLIGGSGVGYVWQKGQIIELGEQIKKREQSLKEIESQNKKLRDQLGMMCQTKYLEAKIRELNLGLVPVQPTQVWRIQSAPEIPVQVRERQYAAQ